MFQNKKRMLYAISVLVGTIVGVGIFGLPYVASVVGFWPMLLYLCGGAVVVYAVHLAYGQAVIAIPKKQRLPGQINDYFGKGWGSLVFINFLIGMYGSLLVYIIVGGQFLHGLLSPIFPLSVFTYTIIFFMLGVYLLYKDIKLISQTEFVMLIFLIILVLAFLFLSFRKIDITNFSGYNLKKIFLPYGIVIFSFWGASILPEIKEMLFTNGEIRSNLSKSQKKFRYVILYSTIISFFIYLFFVIAVLGMSGKVTSTEAFAGLKPFLSGKIIYLGYIFGFLTVITSFLATGITIDKCFQYDYKVSKKLSFILTALIPLVFFLLKFNNFIDIINIVGTITFGIAGFFIFALYFRLNKLGKIKDRILSDLTIYILMIMFVIGIILALIK